MSIYPVRETDIQSVYNSDLEMYISGIMSLYGGIHTVLEVAVSKLHNAVGVAEWLFKSHPGFHGFLVITVMIKLGFLGNKMKI